MRITEGPSKLRARGLTVREVAGCHTRGNEFPSRPDGALRHWTAGARSGHTPSLRIVTYGRSDLPGPLCQVLQSREVDPRTGLDIVYWVASGKANHAGRGLWNGISGNYALLGLEIEWSGPSEQFVGVNKRLLTSELVMRGLLDCCAGDSPRDVAEHREYALPRGRKIDTNLDGDVMRRRMAELAGQRPPTNPANPPIKKEEIDLMYLLNLKGTPYTFLVGPGGQLQVLDQTGFWLYAVQGLPVRTLEPGKPIKDLAGNTLAKDQWDAFVKTQKALRSAKNFGD